MMWFLNMVCKVRDKFLFQGNSGPPYPNDVVSSLKFDNFAALRPGFLNSNFKSHS